MISKELFIECIHFMKERNDAMDKINKLFTEEFEDSVFYPYFKYEAMIGKLLKAAMHDEGDWIDYFLYECDYGKNITPDSVTEADGTPIDITTPEKLYNFLVAEYLANKEEEEE